MHIFLTPWKFIACINVIVTELTQRKIEVQNLTANLIKIQTNLIIDILDYQIILQLLSLYQVVVTPQRLCHRLSTANLSRLWS